MSNPGSLSIAFLAACGPNEYAAETPNGGELTQSVLSYVKGDAMLQTTRPALDLIDLGRLVSAELSERVPDQVPVGWGINLTGEGRFAPNPNFAPATEELAKVASVLRSGSLTNETRGALQRHAFALWSQQRDVEEEVDVPAVRRTLAALIAGLLGDRTAIARALRGLATSFRASAVKSSDVFAESLVLFACAEPFLNLLDDQVAAQVARQLLDEAVQSQAQARQWLIGNLKADRYCLLSNGMADLYFLPLRLSRILGWLAAGVEISRLAGRSDAQAEQELKEIAELLLEHYALSLVPRSDEQSPFVLAFAEAARGRGWTEIAEQVIGSYLGGFVEAQGVIARPDLADDETFRFTVGLGAGPEHVEHSFRANPTQFSSVLLICGAALGMDDAWDPELSHLDHHSGYVFVPTTFTRFAASIVDEGKNLGFQIGRDVFTIADFRAFMQSHLVSAVESASRELSPLSASLALVASCLQPDRLPLHMVDLRAIAGSTPSVSG